MLKFQLWPIKEYEFLPERTFEWKRYVYVVVHGQKFENGSYPNILEGDLYLYFKKALSALFLKYQFFQPSNKSTALTLISAQHIHSIRENGFHSFSAHTSTDQGEWW